MSSKLYTPAKRRLKGLTDKDYYEYRKDDFNLMINESYRFRSLPVVFVHKNNFQFCYDKFVMGGNKGSNRKIQNRRVETFHWIGELLKHTEHCSNCNYCDDVVVYYDPDRDRYNMIDLGNNFLLGFEKKHDFYLLLTGFQMQQKTLESHKNKIVKFGNIR